MDDFQKKTIKTSRGYTYTYYTADGDSSLPALFFQHGWPDEAAMWAGVASRIRSTSKYPIIIPDLLGYGGTDKPTDPVEYKWDVMTKDLIDIIDAEKVDKVISIGHDWGSGCASRLHSYHPDRVAGLVNLNVTYMTPSRQKMNLDAVNAKTEQIFGYPQLAYWYLFTAEDGPAILKDNVERLYPALHGAGITNMKKYFCSRGGMRDYLTSNEPEPEVRPYAQDPTMKTAFVERMRRDGFDGPQCWYKATNSNLQYECDSQLPEDRDKVNVPALYIGAKEDAVCRPEGMMPAIQKGLLPHLERADMLEAGHWTPFEKPDEVAANIRNWLKKTFAW